MFRNKVSDRVKQRVRSKTYKFWITHDESSSAIVSSTEGKRTESRDIHGDGPWMNKNPHQPLRYTGLVFVTKPSKTSLFIFPLFLLLFFLPTFLAFQEGLEGWVRIEETGTSPACALVSNRENKRGVIEALVVSSRSGPRYLSDRAPFFACL